MEQAIEAIFENGTFKIIDPSAFLHLSEGQKVKLVIEEPSRVATDMLALAAQVYEGLSEKEIDEIEQIALDRRDFFGENIPLFR